MRRLALILFPLTLMACGQESPTAPADRQLQPAPSFAASAQQNVITGYADWDYGVPLDCIGEDIHLYGSYTILDHRVTRPDGSVHVVWVVRLGDDWTFVGLVSGDVWYLQPGYNQVQVADHSAGDYLWHEHLTMKNGATGVVMDVPSSGHLVYDANGVVRVDRLDLGSCRLHP
jgi:hypothetical protein